MTVCSYNIAQWNINIDGTIVLGEGYCTYKGNNVTIITVMTYKDDYKRHNVMSITFVI